MQNQRQISGKRYLREQNQDSEKEKESWLASAVTIKQFTLSVHLNYGVSKI